MTASAGEGQTCANEEAVSDGGAAVRVGGVEPVCGGGQQLYPLVLAQRPWSGPDLDPPAWPRARSMRVTTSDR